jgi:hypothetical protein
LQESAKDKEDPSSWQPCARTLISSQEYKEAHEKLCLLTARPVAEREKAIANIREFLGMSDIPVEFSVVGLTTSLVIMERTITAQFQNTMKQLDFAFTIDPKPNYIVEVGEAERRWGTKEDGTRWFENMPEYDNTPDIRLRSRSVRSLKTS